MGRQVRSGWWARALLVVILTVVVAMTTTTTVEAAATHSHSHSHSHSRAGSESNSMRLQEYQVAVVGYHFSEDTSKSTASRQRTELAQKSLESWTSFADAHGFDVVWRQQVPSEWRQAEVHPTGYRFELLRQVLTPEAEGGLGYDAALFFESDTFWTGSARHPRLEMWLTGFPQAEIFLAHSFAYQPRPDPEQEGRSYYILDPDYTAYELDASVFLVRSTPSVLEILGKIAQQCLLATSCEPSARLSHVVEFLTPSAARGDPDTDAKEPKKESPERLLQGFSLGTNFVSSPMLWQPSYFAINLAAADKSSTKLSSTLRTAGRLVTLHSRKRDLSQVEWSKLPLFYSRSSMLMSEVL
jgi:hypothetical protein